jgi:mono/diheme cytochrome c family protein
MRYGLLIATTAALIGIAAPAFAQSPAAIEKGVTIFTAQKCALCHSVAGKGNPKGPLDEVGSTLTAAEIRQWLVNPAEMREKAHAERKPAMKSFSTLSKDDLDALVAYIGSLKKKT